MKGFASDNYAGVLNEVMQALSQANSAHAKAYGADEWTHELTLACREAFAAEVEVLLVFNGTGANVLSVSSATESFHSVLCSDLAHLYCDESSAPETFTGCRFFPLKSDEYGKIYKEAVHERLIRRGDIHYAPSNLLSLTQTTERGTVYTQNELRELADLAHQNGLYVHVDGARFFNAAAHLNCSLADISTHAGVDILSLGGTKIGMMFGEAVIVFNNTLKQRIRYKHKQSMQLASKTRFIAAQFLAILKNDLWRTTAQRSNRLAAQLAEGLAQFNEIFMSHRPQANAVFARMPKAWIKPLQQEFPFYVWDELKDEVRLMCAFDTQEAEIEQLLKAIRRLSTTTTHKA